jgi:hypothetical protein
MPSRIGIAEQVAAGLLVVVAMVVALAYYSATLAWMWRQLW